MATKPLVFPAKMIIACCAQGTSYGDQHGGGWALIPAPVSSTKQGSSASYRRVATPSQVTAATRSPAPRRCPGITAHSTGWPRGSTRRRASAASASRFMALSSPEAQSQRRFSTHRVGLLTGAPCSCPRSYVTTFQLLMRDSCGAVADDCPECAAGSLDFQVSASAECLLPEPRRSVRPEPAQRCISLYGLQLCLTSFPCFAELIRLARPGLVATRPVRSRRLAAALQLPGQQPLVHQAPGLERQVSALPVRGSAHASAMIPSYAPQDIAPVRHHQMTAYVDLSMISSKPDLASTTVTKTRWQQ